MAEVYNKLVRDKIPQIIRADGKVPLLRTLNENEYINALNSKLGEELSEYLSSYEVEELADLLEVIYAILKINNLSIQDLELIRKSKFDRHGGFENRCMLIEVQPTLK